MSVGEVKRKKAMIAMSGGVDSSLAAKLMADRGYECVRADAHAEILSIRKARCWAGITVSSITR